MNALELDHLSKRYGDRYAVNDLSLQIPQGCIFGLLGRNGAGKTTTIDCILGLTRQNSGSVTILDQQLTPSLFERIAYVPESTALEGFMTGAEHARLRASAFRSFDQRLFADLVDRFEVDLSRRVRASSKGQRQALALALAFAQRADLAILDEPASGLDPVSQRHLLDVIVQTGADGRTVVFSSHQIGDIERTVERVAILKRGQLALSADLEDIRQRRTIVEGVFAEAPNAGALKARISGRYDLEGCVVRIYANGDTADVRTALSAFSVVEIREHKMTLEDVFFEAVGIHEELPR
jgi:ABC-2 type transport system ATP-binding protein